MGVLLCLSGVPTLARLADGSEEEEDDDDDEELLLLLLELLLERVVALLRLDMSIICLFSVCAGVVEEQVECRGGMAFTGESGSPPVGFFSCRVNFEDQSFPVMVL